MDSYLWVISNKEIIKIFYGLIITVICAIIVIKVDRLYRISLHQGIRYLRNAFFFYGIGFLIRYLGGALLYYEFVHYDYLVMSLFEFFLITAGFFLLYSLIWKKIETDKEEYLSSLLNGKILVFYLIAISLVVLDYIWQSHYFMFFSQIIVFSLSSIVSLKNYKRNGIKHRFLLFYFIAMFLY